MQIDRLETAPSQLLSQGEKAFSMLSRYCTLKLQSRMARAKVREDDAGLYDSDSADYMAEYLRLETQARIIYNTLPDEFKW